MGENKTTIQARALINQDNKKLRRVFLLFITLAWKLNILSCKGSTRVVKTQCTQTWVRQGPIQVIHAGFNYLSNFSKPNKIRLKQDIHQILLIWN